MKVNTELSLELKKKYNHNVGECYRNSVNIFQQMDNIILVYGYITEDNKVFIRHCWCIKDGEIIDTTISIDKAKEDAVKWKYIEFFRINNNYELKDLIMNTSGPAALEYKPNEEEKFKDKLRKQGAIYFM